MGELVMPVTNIIQMLSKRSDYTKLSIEVGSKSQNPCFYAAQMSSIQNLKSALESQC